MSPTVVYVDDEVLLCRAFRLLLRRAAVEVETFTDPNLALAYLGTHPASVIFCDYRMPRMNGLQLLEALPGNTPFYMVSGDLDAAEWVADNPRVTGVLPKPFLADRIVAIVQQHLAAAG
ncbi:MAG: response regulator [Nannocystaceae bacterium]|jgi:two-component system C4-dicarboxylate transport response regulator DctD